MEMSPASSRLFSALLEKHTGQELAATRRWRIETALNPLMRERGIASLDLLAASLTGAQDPALLTAVVDALLNHETYFYREPSAFELLGQAVAELASKRSEKRLRIWCAGCSTGQEAYSLAMEFANTAAAWQGWTIEILGTDVSDAAIVQAREGLYSQFEIQRGLGVRQMIRWFQSDNEQWRALPELRAKVRFHRHNLLEAPPSTSRFDVILCRNVLLYFTQPARATAFERLASAVAPDGVLMLGAGETVIGQTSRFVSAHDHRGLYRPA